MRRMITQLRARLRDEERGATIVWVATMLVMLFAFTAFAIDFGRIYQERRELQVGAEAAALAIGEDCARGLCDLAYDQFIVAEQYVDANATDGAAWAEAVYLDLANQEVTVWAATEDPSGGHNFDMTFAQIVGFDGFTVRASATVKWGSPKLPATIPIIISHCEWARTDPGWPDGDDPDGPALIEESNVPPPDGTPYATLLFHDGNTTEDCNAVAGQDTDGDDRLPGGFGWLDTESDCEAVIVGAIVDEEDGVVTDYGWVGEDPGASPSNGCNSHELEALLFDEGGVLIPYFDDVQGLGANGEYHIEGYGAFYVLGYNFGGQYKEYRAPLTKVPCKGDQRCLAGYFIEKTITTGEIGGPDFGVTVVVLTG